jgi:hypothetical protein
MWSQNGDDCSPDRFRFQSSTAYEQAKKASRGWDVYALEQEWREWLATKENPDYSAASFVAFCKKKSKL